MGRLVLSRKRREEIVIICGEKQIVIGVAKVLEGKVRLTFEADREIRIFRREVHEAIERKKQRGEGTE